MTKKEDCRVILGIDEVGARRVGWTVGDWRSGFGSAEIETDDSKNW